MRLATSTVAKRWQRGGRLGCPLTRRRVFRVAVYICVMVTGRSSKYFGQLLPIAAPAAAMTLALD